MPIPKNEDEAQFFAHLEDVGEAGVRADLHSNIHGSRTNLVVRWLYEKDGERTVLRDAQALRAIEAAERSARASEQSADGTVTAAKWAMWAAIFSLASIAITIINDFVTHAK